jgi:MGT family glycosyltransferase
VVTLGSGQYGWAEFFPACMAAFAGLPWQVVVAAGPQAGRLRRAAAPANVEVHNRVPLLKVLPHAGLFVTSGGMGSTMESLYFGVPVLAIPHTPDQRAIAERITRLRLGRQLAPADTTARTLRQMAETIIGDDQVPASVSEMQRAVRESGGPAAAADAIEHQLELSLRSVNWELRSAVR